MSVCDRLNAVKFIHDHLDDCTTLAGMLKVPVENVLGLAELESQHGEGRIAREDNNYFSMHAPAPLQIGVDYKPTNPVAKFSSFL